MAAAISPSGTLNQKMIDQWKCSARMPPTTGPPSPAVTQTLPI